MLKKRILITIGIVVGLAIIIGIALYFKPISVSSLLRSEEISPYAYKVTDCVHENIAVEGKDEIFALLSTYSCHRSIQEMPRWLPKGAICILYEKVCVVLSTDTAYIYLLDGRGYFVISGYNGTLYSQIEKA